MIQHELIQSGCFVYQVVRSDKVVVRSTPDLVDDDDDDDEEVDEQSHFENNELLAVDLVQPTSYAVFLRLADQSGWVVAEQGGEFFLRRLPVVTGRLYCFYVDYNGFTVRRHPMDDSSDMLSSESGSPMKLYGMQKIYCDAKVEHPVTGANFYRLQSTTSAAPATSGWVHDRQIVPVEEGEDTREEIRLLPEHSVKTGLFAFRAIQGAAVRSSPDCLDDSKNGLAVQQGEMVVVDVIRESPYGKGNGPFLRLADGSGWLFEHKLGDKIMESVPIETGLWNVCVLNEPVGLGLRQHPVDRQDKLLSNDAYLPGTKLECDRKIVNEEGVAFYRVQGTTGWLFDRRGHKVMLELLSTKPGKAVEPVSPPWRVDFVRGIAATVSGVKELSYDAQNHVLTFENAHNNHVSIFCNSKTVCLTYDHPVRGRVADCQRDCIPSELHSILCKNAIDAMTSQIIREQTEKNEEIGEEKKEENTPEIPTDKVKKNAIEKEEDLRKQLLACDAEIANAQEKRRDLVKAIKGYDNERAIMAAKLMKACESENDQNRPDIFPEELMAKQSKPKVSSSHKFAVSGINSENSLLEHSWSRQGRQPSSSSATASSASVAESSRSTSVLVCRECFQTFSGKYSRDLHCRQVHKLFCEVCDRIFMSSKDLEAHKDIAGHW